MRFAQVESGEIQDRRFLVERATVRQDRARARLQLDVVFESQRLEQTNQRMESGVIGVDLFLRAGGGDTITGSW